MKLFNLQIAPKIENKHRYMRGRFRKSPDEEGNRLADGIMTEERLAVLPVISCPFCLERYYADYYEKRKERYEKAVASKTGTLEFARDQWNMNREQESPDTYYCRGLIEEEIEAKAPHFWQKNEKWFKRSFICLTCGASYESMPYRKNRYVNIR